MSHTFTVTRVINSPEGDSDDAEYTKDGTCDQACSVWYPCKVETCAADDEGVFHGIDHIIVGGIEDYCVPSTECGLTYTFEHENPEWQMTALGTYDVDVTWDGDYWYADLTLRTEATA